MGGWIGLFIKRLVSAHRVKADTVCRCFSVKEEMLEVGVELVAEESMARRRIKVQGTQGKVVNKQSQGWPSMGRNWEAERKSGQGRADCSELRLEKKLLGAVRVASVQDQPLKQNCVCNRH